MSKRILVGAAALALAAAMTIPAVGAAPKAKKNNGPTFVDMNDNGKYDKKTDIAIEKLGGGIKQLDGGKVVSGSLLGVTLLVVANGHDLYINKDVKGSNLGIINRGGDIVVAPGVKITGTNNTFALATRDRSGDNFAGSLTIGEGATVQHTYNGRSNRQVQIEAADLVVGRNVSVASTSGAKKAARAAVGAAGNAWVKASHSLKIDQTASIDGLQVIGPNS